MLKNDKKTLYTQTVDFETSESSIKWDEEEKCYILLQNKVQHVILFSRPCYFSFW